MRSELWIALGTGVVAIVALIISSRLTAQERAIWARRVFFISMLAFAASGANWIWYVVSIDQRVLKTEATQETAGSIPTEVAFQDELAKDIDIVPPVWKFWKWGFDPDADKIREWRAARSDHRLVAYSILNCRKVNDVQRMSTPLFSELLLDLTPNGDHLFRSFVAGLPAIQIQPAEQFVLSTSDSIARTRLAAVAGAAGSVTAVFWLGVSALVVSGLTTIFLTLQGKLKRPADDGRRQPKGSEPAGWLDGGFKYRWTSWWGWRGYHVVAFLALLLSVISTALAGVKQFYDPGKLVVQNQNILPQLWSLHQDVILGIGCRDGVITILPEKDKTVNDRAAAWSTELRALRGKIVLEYGAYVNPANQPASVPAPAPAPASNSTATPPSTETAPPTPPAPPAPGKSSAPNEQ